MVYGLGTHTTAYTKHRDQGQRWVWVTRTIMGVRVGLKKNQDDVNRRRLLST